MIYFLSFLLFITIICGKAKGLSGAIGLVLIDLSLLFSILLVGGYIKL